MEKIAKMIPPLVLLFVFSLAVNAQTAKEIVTRAEENILGQSSKVDLTIEIVRPAWKRTLAVRTWSKGEQYSMMLIMAPPNDAGTVFLKRAREIWNWLPSIERAVKLPPSMMSQSWMGTDFTNDDLVKSSSRINDYNHKIAGDSLIGGRRCWKIEMIPLPEAAVVWSKVNIWIDRQDYLELRLEFFDEDGKLVNVLQCSEIRNLGGRLLPCKMEMIPVGKKGQETIITYNAAVFNQPIGEEFFTTGNMKKAK